MHILTDVVDENIFITALHNTVTKMEVQVSKLVEGVSEKIETCAKKEFLEKGYVDASLRTIAAEAGTTTGSIYSRYGGKEGLFASIVEPAAKEFIEIFREVEETFHRSDPEKQAEIMNDYAKDGMRRMISYMYAHFEEFQLLVSSAYGTKFQNFVEHLVEIETEYTYKYLEVVGLDLKQRRIISKDFMHIMNKAFFESFFEVIRHQMSETEALEYIDMLALYHNAGWSVIYREYGK